MHTRHDPEQLVVHAVDLRTSSDPQANRPV